MSDDAFIGEIRLLPYDYTPETWLPCNGQLAEINRYQALYSLIETTYGGDGRRNFGIPNLNGRIPVGIGSRLGGAAWSLGQNEGTMSVTLDMSQMPSHTHTLNVKDPTVAPGGLTGTPRADALISRARIPPNNVIAAFQKPPGEKLVDFGMQVAPQFGFDPTTGKAAAHDNMQPYVAMHYCICVEGEYPVSSEG